MLFIGDYIHSKADGRTSIISFQRWMHAVRTLSIALSLSTSLFLSLCLAGLIVIVCGNLTSTFCLCLCSGLLFSSSPRWVRVELEREFWLIFLLLFALPPWPAACLFSGLYPHEFVCWKNFACSCQDSPTIFLITRVMWWIYKFVSLVSLVSLCLCKGEIVIASWISWPVWEHSLMSALSMCSQIFTAYVKAPRDGCEMDAWLHKYVIIIANDVDNRFPASTHSPGRVGRVPSFLPMLIYKTIKMFIAA